MLYTAQWVLFENSFNQHPEHLKPYKIAHINHPTTKWIRYSKSNYIYACKMGLELCYEYTRRYKKQHVCQQRLEWLLDFIPTSFCEEEEDNDNYYGNAHLATQNVPTGCTPIPLAMPEEYHSNDVIQSYRLYYIREKYKIAGKKESIVNLVEQWTNDQWTNDQ